MPSTLPEVQEYYALLNSKNLIETGKVFTNSNFVKPIAIFRIYEPKVNFWGLRYFHQLVIYGYESKRFTEPHFALDCEYGYYDTKREIEFINLSQIVQALCNETELNQFLWHVLEYGK